MIKNNQFICNECVFVFKILTPMGRGYRKHCPKCGDYVSVETFEKSKVTNTKKIWNDEELKDLDRCIAGEVLSYQLAAKLGRSPKSVSRRKERRIEELAKKNIPKGS
ncbi:Uncharacterised protein [Acinetobacter baumannii]|nr:Uncharacterised protein [Acinetobacter baumannii]